jgi:ABC-type phosphate/phosphonate transport system substrate-binding protein
VHDVAARTYGDLQALLLKKFKIKLVLEYFIEPYQLEDRLITGKVDGAICKPWLAYRLAPKHGMQYRRIADILDPRNNQFLTGIFIVCKDSPIKTFAELNQKALVTGDPYAYEKFYLPAKMLRDAKIAPSRTYTKSSCIECIGELMDGKADAAAISDYALTADCAVDVAKPDDFRIIGTTAKTPLTSVILDFRRVSEKDALRLQRALLAITWEITPKTLLGNGFAPPAPWTPDTSAK